MTRTSFRAQRIAYEAGHLLDLKDANDRALRDYVPDDCYERSGWLAPVGWWIDDRAGKRAIGDVFNEEQLGWYFMVCHIFHLRWAPADHCEDQLQPGDKLDAKRWEPAEPHFGRYANHFDRYAQQLDKVFSKVRRRKKSSKIFFKNTANGVAN